MFYVYKHIRPDTNVCFYIGHGCKKRAWTMYGRSYRHKAVLDELQSLGLSVVVEIVAEFETAEESMSLEKELVETTPNLINILPGGVPSVRGLKWTEEQCQKQRKPKPEGFGNRVSKSLTGRTLSEEHKQAIRDGMKRGNRLGKGGAKSTERLKEKWADPEYRAMKMAQLRDPVYRAEQSARAKKQWAERKRQKVGLLPED